MPISAVHTTPRTLLMWLMRHESCQLPAAPLMVVAKAVSSRFIPAPSTLSKVVNHSASANMHAEGPSQ